jgi:hypothetical protein
MTTDKNIEPTTADFGKGDVVQHIFFGRYATVVKVGRKYLHVELHTLGGNAPVVTWRPTSVRLVKASADYTHTFDATFVTSEEN